MEKLLAWFPNLTLEKPCTLWGIDFKPLKFRTLATWNYKSEEELKSVSRQLEILRCHLFVGAYIIDKNPCESCKVIKLKDDEEIPIVNNKEDSLSINLLANLLPKNLEETGRTVSWFNRYLEQPIEEERARVFRLYNALGTLPGGFGGILSISSKEEDIDILKRLLNRIEDFHREDEEEEAYMHKTRELSNEEIRGIEKCYLKALSNLGVGIES